ncbi:MAG: sigma-70 family RNA polymerase sigma factor [Pseudomonadota bacterium]
MSADAALLSAIANGDQAALKGFFVRHRAGVFRFIARMSRNEAVAEEITNEVFLEVWRNAHRYEGRSAPTTWLLSIARNRTISALRKRREESWDDAAAETLADEDDTPDVVSQKADKAKVLRACMAKLSAEHAEVIDLVYYHEKSLSEVSTITGVAEATVKTRLFYARKKLSEICKQSGVDRGWP